MLTFSLALAILTSVPDNQIEYTISQDGPLTIYRGYVRQIKTALDPGPVFSFVFEVPEGELTGSKVGSSPYSPMLGNIATHSWLSSRRLSVTWDWLKPVNNPITGENHQFYPCYGHRNFSFHIKKTSFGADDLADLLNDWGLESSWDLDRNGLVDGGDISLLVGSWQKE